MQTINLKKYYYPIYRADTYLTVPDEVAEALLLMLREENNRTRKIWYHKAYFYLDCEDGIENEAAGWAQPSPEDYLLKQEEQAEQEELVRRLYEALSTLTPIQARRVHARYMLGMKIREIAEMEGVDSSRVSQSIRGAVKRLRRYFDRQKWTGRSL